MYATLLEAVHQADSDIHLVMFGLHDPGMLAALEHRTHEGVPLNLYFDPNGSPHLHQRPLGAAFHPIRIKGLMHQKILVIDDSLVFIGSANFTASSLKMHDNLVIGMWSPTLAQFLKDHPPPEPGHFRAFIGGQDVELWLLPDARGSALAEMRHLIREAKEEVHCGLFALTHSGLIDELIDAQRRGVKVHLALDRNAGYGSSAKGYQRLREAGIRVRLSEGMQLLHHKFLLIDGKTLISGSANWTKAAFNQNSDCLLILRNLNPQQQKVMMRIWRRLETESAVALYTK